MPHFQTAIALQRCESNSSFLVLIERATLREHDSVYLIKFLIKKTNCLQGFLKATFDLCVLTRKTGQYKLPLT